MKINLFQIENMRISKLIIVQSNQERILVEKKNHFSEIEEKLLKENEIIELFLEIELLPFGKFVFGKEESKKEIKGRHIDGEGNIIIVISGI